MLLGQNKLTRRSILPSSIPPAPKFNGPRNAKEARNTGVAALAAMAILTLLLLFYRTSPEPYIPVQGEGGDPSYTPGWYIIPTAQDIASIKGAGGPPRVMSPLRTLVHKGPTSPKIVLVTSLDADSFTSDTLSRVLNDRKQYAQTHGYGLYARFAQEYGEKYTRAFYPTSWAKVSVARAAMHAFPDAEYFWYLDQNAVIMNPKTSVESLIQNVGTDMLTNQNVVHKSSVIKTDSKPYPNRVEFIFSQDEIGLSSFSFIYKNSDFSKSLLEYWNDPRHYNYWGFEKAESSALNHLAQWHPSMFRRMALISARKFASMTAVTQGFDHLLYGLGDFVVTLRNCQQNPTNCETDLNKYLTFKKSL
jgi:mannan polymerase II complex MNN11 subunit